MESIALCFPLTGPEQARLENKVGDAVVHVVTDEDADPSARDRFMQCDIAFGNPPADWVASAPTLRWIQLESVGFGEYSSLNWPALEQRFSVTNLAGFFADPVAESALAGILALGRGIDRLVRLQENATWVGDPVRAHLRLLLDAKIALIGFGAIARRLSELLAPFDCQITTIRSDDTPAALDAALKSADIVVCTVPETHQTIDLIDTRRLDLLSSGAIFVNFGRGSVVDEAALAKCLSDGRLGGAVLDVTLDEPLPKDHPFWACPNTIITQHCGGGTIDENDRKVDFFLANLARYRRGAPLLNIVDFARGY